MDKPYTCGPRDRRKYVIHLPSREMSLHDDHSIYIAGRYCIGLVPHGKKKSVGCFFLSTQKVIYLKPKGVKDYLLNLPS